MAKQGLQTTFRLSADEVTILETVQAKLGLRARSEVIRIAIRQLGDAYGVEVSKPKRTSQVKRPPPVLKHRREPRPHPDRTR